MKGSEVAPVRPITSLWPNTGPRHRTGRWGYTMRCARCGTYVDLEDSFCRRCGAALNSHLPTVVSRSLLPVPWTLARGRMLQGVAALAVGTVVELMRREVARRMAPPDPSAALAVLSSGQPVEAKRGRFPWSRAPRGEYEVTETVFQKRVRFFRR